MSSKKIYFDFLLVETEKYKVYVEYNILSTDPYTHVIFDCVPKSFRGRTICFHNYYEKEKWDVISNYFKELKVARKSLNIGEEVKRKVEMYIEKRKNSSKKYS